MKRNGIKAVNRFTGDSYRLVYPTRGGEWWAIHARTGRLELVSASAFEITAKRFREHETR